jgi:hypothetical protein
MPYVIAPADLYLPAISDRVKAGDVVEVDDEAAASLRAQGWEAGKAPKRTPAPAEKADLEKVDTDK